MLNIDPPQGPVIYTMETLEFRLGGSIVRSLPGALGSCSGLSAPSWFVAFG